MLLLLAAALQLLPIAVALPLLPAGAPQSLPAVLLLPTALPSLRGTRARRPRNEPPIALLPPTPAGRSLPCRCQQGRVILAATLGALGPARVAFGRRLGAARRRLDGSVRRGAQDSEGLCGVARRRKAPSTNMTRE